MSALINQAQGYLATGANPRRLGNDHPSIAPYGPVRTSDGYVLIAVGTDSQYAKLCRALNARELDTHDEWATNDRRVQDRAALSSVLDNVFSQADTTTWLERLGESGVPHAPILDVAGAFAQPQVALGDFVGETDAPAGPMRTMRSPLRVDGERLPIRRGPRRLGEDTDEVFS
jgi:crotonobetainyl-CoA:carnitine CoA-transferase CaiB-like acyl-CoA transferase